MPGFGADPSDPNKFNKLFSFGARSFSIWKYEENKVGLFIAEVVEQCICCTCHV
jgi:hypothetical protein